MGQIDLDLMGQYPPDSTGQDKPDLVGQHQWIIHVRLLIIACLYQSKVAIEKEISDMIIKHKKRIKDIMRYYPQNDPF